MSSTGIDFPRGNYPVVKDSLAKKGVKRPIGDELFTTRSKNVDEDGKASKKKKREKSVRPDEDDGVVPKISKEQKVNIYKMSVSKLPINSTILGCIHEIKDYEMSVFLPGAILAKISITNISDDYNKSLMAYTKDPQNAPCPRKPKSMFMPGDLLPVKILDKKDANLQFEDSALSLVDIEASLNPRDIHDGFTSSTFLANCTRLTVSAAVKSVEDHGYTMDLGFDDISGFLSSEEATTILESHHQNQLHVGQVILCQVLSSSERIVRLTTKPIKSKITSQDTDQFPSSCLLPGVIVPATILDVNENGLEVAIYNQYQGFVHRDHLKSIWDLPKEDYQIGSQVRGMVLFVNPLTRAVALTLRLRNEMQGLKKTWSTARVGQLIESAQLVGKGEFDSFIFKLPNGLKGIAPRNELSDDYLAREDMAIIENQMPIGSYHTCRVKSLAYLDGYVKVTLKPSLLSAEYIPIESLKVGQIVEASVKKYTKSGLILRLGFALKAFCPPIHYMEKGIGNPTKHFAPGKKVKCRTLRIDKRTLIPRIAVTCRKALLSEDFNILDTFNKANAGFATKGVVALIKSDGLLVEFFNGMRGWLSSKHMQKEGLQYSETSFHVGQVLSVYVLHSQREEKKIHLSLYLDSTETKKASKKKLKTFPPGTILSGCKVDRKESDGLYIKNQESSEFFLPKGHLSDYPDLIPLLYQSYDVGDAIDELVVFNTAKNLVVVSKKLAFIHASKNKSPVFSSDKIDVGSVVPAMVKSLKSYGMLMELPGNLLGLVHQTEISHHRVDPLNCEYAPNQTLYVCVKEVKEDGENKRLSLTTTLAYCPTTEMTPNLILRHYFQDYAFIKSKLGSFDDSPYAPIISSLKTGQIIPFEVESLREANILCRCQHPDFETKVPAIIKKVNSDPETKLKIGTRGQGVVLHVDIALKLFYLTNESGVLKKAKSAVKNTSYQRVKPGQILIGEVQLTTDKFVIVCLHGHGIGALAYISRVEHLNSLKPTSSDYDIGDKLYFQTEEVFEAEDGTTFIIGNKTKEKPNSRKNKEAQRAAAQQAKKEAKRLARLNKRKRNDSGTDGNDNEDQGQDSHTDSGLDDVDDGDEDIDFDDDSDNEDEDEPGFFYDFKGTTKRDLIRSLRAISNESDFSSQESDEEAANASEDDNHSEGGNEKKEKKRTGPAKISSQKLKDMKKRHFRKLQALVSDRIKSAVDVENNNFFWDTEKEEKSVGFDEDKLVETPISRGVDEDDEDDAALSKEQFEKLVVETPNDAKRWAKYINYYLDQGEVNKAKELCERALEVIDHKEEDAKLRIWILKLKIEDEHGTPESLDALFKEALRANDELKMYQNMIKIHEENGKTELVEQVYKEATKKFPLNKPLWVDFGRFYLKNGLKESCRSVFQRCLNYLDKKDQLDIIVKFAQLECQFGDIERAKSLFEAALVNFPKRTDIWSIYIDMMIKYSVKDDEIKKDSLESLRILFDRAISLKLKAKKVKFLFQKYIDFERKYGDEERIASINKKALEYIEANDFLH